MGAGLRQRANYVGKLPPMSSTLIYMAAPGGPYGSRCSQRAQPYAEAHPEPEKLKRGISGDLRTAKERSAWAERVSLARAVRFYAMAYPDPEQGKRTDLPGNRGSSPVSHAVLREAPELFPGRSPTSWRC
jgi:hypothetical protein